MPVNPPKAAVQNSVFDSALESRDFSISAYGVRIDFHLPCALIAELPSPVIPGAVDDDRSSADATVSVKLSRDAEGEPIFELMENGVSLAKEASATVASHMVESWAQLTVATMAKDLIFVHAAVVGWKNKAIVVPGRTLSGKSTLAMALAEAGAEYYSDEYAIFDPEGKVHPYWRLPKIKGDSGYKVARLLKGGDLTGPPPVPLPLGWVLISYYDPGSVWQPRKLTCGETLLGLLDNTVPLRVRPEQSVKALSKAIADAQGFESSRGDAASEARIILSLL